MSCEPKYSLLLTVGAAFCAPIDFIAECDYLSRERGRAIINLNSKRKKKSAKFIRMNYWPFCDV